MSLILSGTNGLSDVDGSAATPAIRGTDTNTGIFFPAADTVGISTGGTERARVDSSGNLGLGVTPSGNFMLEAGSTTAAGRSFKLMTLTGGFSGGNYPFFGYNFRSTTTSGTYRYDGNDAASAINFSGGIAFNVAASGTAGNAITWNTAMTLDANGKLLVGGTASDLSSSSQAMIIGSGGLSVQYAGTTDTYLKLTPGAANGVVDIRADARSGGYPALTFTTGAAERARIDSSGNLQVGLTNIASYVGSSPVGSIANLATTAGTNCAAFIHSHSSNPYGPFFYFNGGSPNNTSNYFLTCNDTTNQKAVIYSSGTFGSRTSTYGGISDIKVKQDIVDASSQWGDIKALRFRKYRFKDDPTGPLQLGLISQEAELVSPGLVFETPDTINVEVPVLDENGDAVFNEDGTPQTTTERQETGEVTKSVKYSILYMKAVVALQEAMNRIEQLEADVAALKGTQP